MLMGFAAESNSHLVFASKGAEEDVQDTLLARSNEEVDRMKFPQMRLDDQMTRHSVRKESWGSCE